MEGTKEWVRTNRIEDSVVQEYEAEYSAENKTLEQGQPRREQCRCCQSNKEAAQSLYGLRRFHIFFYLFHLANTAPKAMP